MLDENPRKGNIDSVFKRFEAFNHAIKDIVKEMDERGHINFKAEKERIQLDIPKMAA